MLAKIALGLASLGFLGFGTAALIAPVQVMAGADLVLTDARAIVEIRAFYGGLELALGVLLLLAIKAKYQSAGLILGFASYFGIAIARALGMIIGGASSSFLWFALVTELVFAGLCLAAWWPMRGEPV